jgi:hypothetical protein
MLLVAPLWLQPAAVAVLVQGAHRGLRGCEGRSCVGVGEVRCFGRVGLVEQGLPQVQWMLD